MTSPVDPHSLRYFTDARDHWWNDDYVGLLATRLGVEQARTILDVGTGQGHFARAWAPHFSAGFALTGIDREEASLAVARERCEEQRVRLALEGTFGFVRAGVEALPFPDASFDMVMCQTLLIHVPDPQHAFDEMLRVTRPGGLVLAVEPNNLGGLQRIAARGPDVDPERQLHHLRFHVRCTRGKHALGLGWNNLGVWLPKLFGALSDVRYANNDRAWVMAPPYDSAQETSALEDMRRDVHQGVAGWPRDEARRYYVAGGGTVEDFERDYDAVRADEAEELQRCECSEWVELTAFAGLVAAGRKLGGLVE